MLPDETGRSLVLQRWMDDGIGVLIPLATWRELTAIEFALRNAATWGDFARMAPAGTFELLAEDWRYADLEVPRPEDPFDDTLIAGKSEGDYPPWWQSADADFLPGEFLERFGEYAFSGIGQHWVLFPVEEVEEMRAALAPHGYEIRFVAEYS